MAMIIGSNERRNWLNWRARPPTECRERERARGRERERGWVSKRECEWSKRERMLTLCTYACYACAYAVVCVCVCGCIHTVSAFVCCGWLMYTLALTNTHTDTQLHTGAYLPLCSVNMFSPTVGLQRLSLWDALEPPPPRLDPLEPMLMPLLPWPADWCDFMREPRSVDPALRPPPPLELPPLMQCGDPDATGLLLDTPMQLTVLPPCPPPPPPPPPLECEPRSLPCWAPILSNHMHPTAIYTLVSSLFVALLSALFSFFLSLIVCTFFCLNIFYILSHSRICFI